MKYYKNLTTKEINEISGGRLYTANNLAIDHLPVWDGVFNPDWGWEGSGPGGIVLPTI
ncbi:hypothetical protein ACE939_13610 [Aquimarina sp. W85]|uniref:hypothetical protein n=1 Tax=Aquimarina rhodophyticola TaxID=3342246 RepID=UPI00366C6F3A